MSQNLHPEISYHHPGVKLINWGKRGSSREDGVEEIRGLWAGPSVDLASGLCEESALEMKAAVFQGI